jgi:transposase
MKTIGVDLHKDSLTAVVLDEARNEVSRKVISCKCRNQIAEWFASFGKDSQVALESVGFYQWFWTLIQPLVGKLILADPARVRAYAGGKAKTDRNDALLLAQLLFDGRLPTAYVPSPLVQALRDLVRLRHSIARNLARERHSLRWLSLKMNLPGPETLTSDRAQKWLLANQAKFPPAMLIAARLRLGHIVRLEQDVYDVEKFITAKISESPELARTRDLLQSVPGIGPIVAATILAELGDIRRFDSPDELGAYAGMVPRVVQSGAYCHHGHITKQGPPILRWCMQQAAWVAVRCHERARNIMLRIARRSGQKKAVTAMGRKLLVYAWSVCRRNTPFEWPAEQSRKTGKTANQPVTEGVLCYQI